jgi:hypothetical protein
MLVGLVDGGDNNAGIGGMQKTKMPVEEGVGAAPENGPGEEEQKV